MAQSLHEFLPGVKYNGLNTRIVSGKGATYTLLPSDGGSMVLFDAASQVYTLPKPSAGAYYNFYTTLASSTNQEVDTDAATTFIGGCVELLIAASATSLGATANGTSIVKIAMNGTTTGGIIGSFFRMTAIDATHWWVWGTLSASGSLATPFA